MLRVVVLQVLFFVDMRFIFVFSVAGVVLSEVVFSLS